MEKILHLSVDETLDAVSKKCVDVNWLHSRLGNLQHDGPVRAFLRRCARRLAAIRDLDRGELNISLRLVVGGVVREDVSSVERAVVFGEV